MNIALSSTPLIEADNLVVGRPHRVVLRAVSFRAVAGQRMLVTGRNGAGKTSLLLTLAGLQSRAAGRVRVMGADIGKPGANRRRVGMVAHATRLYDELTLRENILFAARMQQIRQPATVVREFLDRAGLGPWSDRVPCQVPHGMLRRASIVRALIHRPPVWLLDEPCAGLDDDGVDWLVGLVKSHCNEGGVVLAATHRVEVWHGWADEVMHLEDGRARISPETRTSLGAA